MLNYAEHGTDHLTNILASKAYKIHVLPVAIHC